MKTNSDTFKGKKVLITVGPTREYLDPVRFITNESSGKMGYALAEELQKLGAELIVVFGPVHIETTIPPGNIINVTTASEMYETCKPYFSLVDIAIFTAAVADYRPRNTSISKTKKHTDIASVEFVRNPDIAYEFGKVKKKTCQLSIGFAIETDDVLANAQKKLHSKNFDMVVINSPNKGEGFGYDTNIISILNAQNEIKQIPKKHKKEVAVDILAYADGIMNHTMML